MMKLPANSTLLGLLTCLAVLGVIVLSFTGRPLPDVLPALAIAGLSALAGLAMPSNAAAATVLYAPPPAPLVGESWTPPGMHRVALDPVAAAAAPGAPSVPSS